MRKFITFVDSFIDYTGQGLAYLIIPMSLIVLYTAGMRYFFNISVPWGFELSLFAFGIHGIVGGAYCLLKGGHVGVDVITSRLPKRVALIMDILGYIMVIFVAIVLVYLGYRWAMRSTLILERSIHGTEFNPQIWWFKWMVPFAGLLLILQGLSQICKDILAFNQKEEEE